MKKAAKESKKTPNQTPETNTIEQEAPHPAQIEADSLRIELAEERFKTEALSRRCIRLGEALEGAIRAEDTRTEQSMFNHINDRCLQKESAAALDEYRRQVFEQKQRHRLERERKIAEAVKKALGKSATGLACSFTGGFIAALLGFAGYIHTFLAVVFTSIALVAFGWWLNSYISLLGRCK